MNCRTVTLPGGQRAFVCGPHPRAKRCGCGSGLPGDLLCDWKMPGRPTGTCDAKLCKACTHVPAEDKDLCPAHATEWKARQR